MRNAIFDARQVNRLVGLIPQSMPPVTDALGIAHTQLPETATAGGAFAVLWSGPDAEDDRITRASSRAAAGDSLASLHTRFGNPATLRLPDDTGAFELRCRVGFSGRAIARPRFTIGATE